MSWYGGYWSASDWDASNWTASGSGGYVGSGGIVFGGSAVTSFTRATPTKPIQGGGGGSGGKRPKRVKAPDVLWPSQRAKTYTHVTTLPVRKRPPVSAVTSFRSPARARRKRERALLALLVGPEMAGV